MVKNTTKDEETTLDIIERVARETAQKNMEEFYKKFPELRPTKESSDG